MLQVDPNFLWATWESGTPVVDTDVGLKTPIAEEVLIHMRSPFHEVRMTALNYVVTLFTPKNSMSLNADHNAWQTRIFDKLRNIVMSSFIVEVQYDYDNFFNFVLV
jgi:hypothetical protein